MLPRNVLSRVNPGADDVDAVDAGVDRAGRRVDDVALERRNVDDADRKVGRDVAAVGDAAGDGLIIIKNDARAGGADAIGMRRDQAAVGDAAGELRDATDKDAVEATPLRSPSSSPRIVPVLVMPPENVIIPTAYP